MFLNRRQRQPDQPPPGAPPPFIPKGSQGNKGGGPQQASYKPGPQQGPPQGPPPGPPPEKKQGKSQGKNQGQNQGPTVKAVDSGAIFPCVYRYVYIWPNRGPGFWAYVTYVGRNSIAGWRYTGRRWVYFGMDLRQIESFYCY